jgi:hypothetical protein
MADKIFINYRREESGHVAGRLHDRLAQAFGRDNLFMDVDNIPVGVDFVTHLNDQVAACDAVLVVIGPNWLKAKDKAGQRRLHRQWTGELCMPLTYAIVPADKIVSVGTSRYNQLCYYAR